MTSYVKGALIQTSDHHHEELIQTLCEKGHLDRALDALSRMPTSPSTSTYLSLLKACIKSKARAHAKRAHAHLTHHRTQLSGLLGGYLVVTLAKCGAIEDALQISCGLPSRTVFSWTAIISAYAECGFGLEALRVHRCMQEDGVTPNVFTYASLFKACGSIPDLEQGKKLHTDAHIKGFTSDVFVGNTLVSMYGKCGALGEAEDVFSALSQHNLVSWTAMLSAYVEQGQGSKALRLYRQIEEDGTCPNQHTFVFALQACSTLLEMKGAPLVKGQSTKTMALEIGQALHADALRKGYACDVFVGTALFSMYGKCGAVVEAEGVFKALFQRDIVSWNAMLSAYSEQVQEEKVLLLYRQMQEEGMSPNQLTFVIVLEACGNIAEKEEALAVQTKAMPLDIGRAFHFDVNRNGYTSDVFVGTALLSMYGKCRVVVDAESVFGALPQRNIVTWTAMLSAYVEQGQGEKALTLYRQMQKEDIALDDVILLCILQACGETGSLEVCKQLHFNIVSVGYDGISFVAATVIHAYGSCASMLDAQVIFSGLPDPAIESWNACIAGHAGEGNSVASIHMFERLRLAGFKPDGITFNAVFSVCSHAGLVVHGCKYFTSMSRDHGISPGLKHYGSMVDLLGRAGDVKMADKWLREMPMQADPTLWSCLLGACRMHGNVELAKQAFDHAVNLQPKQVVAYILMSNMYVMQCAADMENSREKEGEVSADGDRA